MIKINPTVFGGDSGDFGDSPPVLCFGVPGVDEKVGTVGTMCCDYQVCLQNILRWGQSGDTGIPVDIDVPHCPLRFYMGLSRTTTTSEFPVWCHDL